MVIEEAIYKWITFSRKTFEPVLRLKILEIEYNIKVYFIHITENTLIASRIDALSRWNVKIEREGIMPYTFCVDRIISQFELLLWI